MAAKKGPLKIAVLGAGKIGSAFAFQLARVGGHAVTVIARPNSPRLQQLEHEQAIVQVDGERAPVTVASMLDEREPFDLVIVTLLAHQVQPLVPLLQRSAASCIQFMFNTFEPETLDAAVGSTRCGFGMPFVQSTFDPEGRLKVAIGSGGQKTIINRQEWVDVFNASGLPAALEPDMPLWLRCHVPFCVAFESVCVAGMRRGGGASWTDAQRVARGVHASFGIIKAMGYEIYPRSKRRMDRSPVFVMATLLWFVSRIRSFRELLATGKAECNALVGTMITLASHAGYRGGTSAIAAMKP